MGDNSSRTSRSIKNARIALFFYVINLILQFFSRKIFLDYLGSEILGLNTTTQNLLGFMNLAELGIGTAVAYNLYKPLFDGNRQIINEIVSVQGWIYRRIAYFVIMGSCVLMCFFPMIFAKAQLPLWYTYGTFIVLLISALLGYFINYKQIVLSADQREYKITFCVQGVKVVKIVLQILAIQFFSGGYIYWMFLELVAAIVISLLLNKTIKKTYPWLNPVIAKGHSLQRDYPDIIIKTKQLFYHKIAGFVLTQTSPIIIYSYASLSLVAVYGNYMLIVLGITALINALLNSIGAGIGNLVASGNRKQIKVVFWELTTLRIVMASIICYSMYSLGHSFITLWVGKAYLLPQSTFIVLIVITFISITRTNDLFLGAYGLYHDVMAPVTEAVLNLFFSILLGYYFGLIGILTGVAISLIMVVVIWKPYFLYRCGFKESIGEYIIKQLKYVILITVAILLSKWIENKVIGEFQIHTYWEWLKYGFLIVSVYSVLAIGLFCALDQSMRNIVIRAKRMLV